MGEPPVLRQIDETRVLHAGRKLIYFGGSDYLRMSWHPKVREAAGRGVARDGLSACASRLTTGNVPIYGELERALASFLGASSATLTSAGYLAPMALAQAVSAEFTHVLLDQRAHGCLRDAATLTGLPVRVFPHREVEGLAAQIAACGRAARCLVMSDGLFTHSGCVAPIREYLEVLPKGSHLVIDDAHGTAVLGARGRGSAEWQGVATGRLWLTTTLSKGLGCYGGAVLGPRSLRTRLLARSSIMVGNTAMPPSMASAAVASLAILRKDGAARRTRLAEVSGRLRARLRAAGMPIPEGPGPMFTYAPPTAIAANSLRRQLLAAGIYPPLIRYPNGPAAQFFRFALSSEHREGQVAALESVLLAHLQREGAYDGRR